MLTRLWNYLSGRSRRQALPSTSRVRPHLECLEDRTTPTAVVGPTIPDFGANDGRSIGIPSVMHAWGEFPFFPLDFGGPRSVPADVPRVHGELATFVLGLEARYCVGVVRSSLDMLPPSGPGAEGAAASPFGYSSTPFGDSLHLVATLLTVESDFAPLPPGTASPARASVETFNPLFGAPPSASNLATGAKAPLAQKAIVADRALMSLGDKLLVQVNRGGDERGQEGPVTLDQFIVGLSDAEARGQQDRPILTKQSGQASATEIGPVNGSPDRQASKQAPPPSPGTGPQNRLAAEGDMGASEQVVSPREQDGSSTSAPSCPEQAIRRSTLFDLLVPGLCALGIAQKGRKKARSPILSAVNR